MPRPVLITTLALAALAGLAGFWLGLNRNPDDISGLVNSVARAHIATHGGTTEACIGWVIEGEEFLRVTCGTHEYRIDRQGRVLKVAEPET